MWMAVVSILGVLAVAAWTVAVYSAARIVALAPDGSRIKTLFTLGWWQFDKVKAIAGPSAQMHISWYVRAFAAFLLAVVLIALLSILVAQETTGPASEEQAAEPRGINDPRIIAVGAVSGVPDSTRPASAPLLSGLVET